MSLNMEALRETFLEESFEGLTRMENVISSVDIEDPDKEEINDIFRAIHSIKGGAPTFGFNEIVEVTHTFENILDEIRNEKLTLTQQIVDVFFRAIANLEDILTSYAEGENPDNELIAKIMSELNSIHGVQGTTNLKSSEKSKIINKATIRFKPDEDILMTGNEPHRILRELAGIGDYKAEILPETIPKVSDDMTKIKLEWKITITGDDLNVDDIKEAFEWIEDECLILDFSFESLKSTVNNKPNQKNIKQKSTKTTSSIRVDTSKIDEINNLIGELVITQSMIGERDSEGNISIVNIDENLATLDRQMRELQEASISIRMIPISAAFNRLPRIVRETSAALNKTINLNITGENTEVDKAVSEKITDPLVHIIRNAVDHGIEDAETRLKLGKEPNGTINIDAYHQGGNLIIDIKDNGGGINTEKVLQKAIEKGVINKDNALSKKEIDELIFAPGFSTADKVSDVSGRGVGMDVVKRNIQALKGQIDLHSEQGKGSLFRIQLPLTLAILDGQLARIGEQTFIIPILTILESIKVRPENIKSMHGNESMYKLRDEFIPIVDLFHIFNIKKDIDDELELLVIVEFNKKKVSVKISELLNQQQVVIKNLDTNYKQTDGFSGATILGNGTVSLILDLPQIIKSATKEI